MSRPLRFLGKMNRTLARLCLFASACGLVLMTVVIGVQVFGRYVLNHSPSWSETFCLLLMLYYIMFAAAAGVRDKFHIGLTLVFSKMPPSIQRGLTLFSFLVLALFGVGMVWFGSQMTATTWSHIIPTLEIPTGLSYLPFPIAGVLFVLFSVEHIMAVFAGEEVASSWS